MTPEANRAMLRQVIAARRADLAFIQSTPHHRFDPKRGLVLSNVCPRCPARRACRATSIALAELESKLFAGDTL